MTRSDEGRRPPRGDDPERRRRQFEDSRGLTGRPELPLEQEGTDDEPDAPEVPREHEEPPPKDEARRNENDLDRGRDAQ